MDVLQLVSPPREGGTANFFGACMSSCFPAFPAATADADSKKIFENYHNVKGTQRFGFIVDPGAASGIGGTDTNMDYDAANVPFCEQCEV